MASSFNTTKPLARRLRKSGRTTTIQKILRYATDLIALPILRSWVKALRKTWLHWPNIGLAMDDLTPLTDESLVNNFNEWVKNDTE